MKHEPITSMGPARAFVLLRSGGRLDLLNPRFDCWTDEDLALNLARISRWGGATRWHEPLSVAQQSLLVLQIRGQDEVLIRRRAGLSQRRFRELAVSYLGCDDLAHALINNATFAGR